MQAHIFRELVNDLRDLAIKFHDHQSLRERLGYRMKVDIKIDNDPADYAPTVDLRLKDKRG